MTEDPVPPPADEPDPTGAEVAEAADGGESPPDDGHESAYELLQRGQGLLREREILGVIEYIKTLE